MKLTRIKPVKNALIWTFLCQIYLLPSISLAQQAGKSIRITLQQAIILGKGNNNLVKAAQSEESAAKVDLKDAKTGELPAIVTGGDYERFSSLTLYNNFLGDAYTVPKRPSSNGADLNVSATFNVYSGGRQKAFEAEQTGKKELATINTLEQTANVELQVVAEYLGLVRLSDQKRFINEQVFRAETRLKNINALCINQKVTRSDVLRAELVLSAVQLNLEQAENDITIASRKLNVLLNVPDSLIVLPADSANMVRPLADTLPPLVNEAARNAYVIQRSAYNIRIQEARVSGIKSNYLPSVAIFSAYGISYPNAIFYPPVDQAYSIGYVGLKVSYNISSLYQNKNKMSAGRFRVQELNFVQQNTKDNVRQEADGLLIRYREALNRITVNEKSIEQARVNYRIVSAKYFNQLALLTDLLDADNIYQESRFNLVQAQTSAQFIYYQLLYASGRIR
jgi:outer membrane protein